MSDLIRTLNLASSSLRPEIVDTCGSNNRIFHKVTWQNQKE